MNKSNKFYINKINRGDQIHSPYSLSSNYHKSKYRHDEHDDRGDYKKLKTSRSRSRSRSSSRTRQLDSGAFSHASKSSFNNGHSDKKFNPGQPSRTIMLRQLPFEMDDNELRNELHMLAVPYKDVRLVRNRDTGASRGFAFVEFSAVEEAQYWMNATQGWLVFGNYDNRVQLYYSHSGADESNSVRGGSSQLSTDWDCSKCGIKNFKRRDKCFKCGITREESDRRRDGEGYDFVGQTACNTLLLRGLDALTTSDTIIKILDKHSNSTLPIKNCHIAKDLHTNVSSGFAFVEMTTIQDAGYMLQVLNNNLEVDGKLVTISYCKNSYKTAITQLENQTHKTYDSYDGSSMYTHNSRINNKINQTDQANSAAAVAQAALQNMHKKQELLTQITTNLKNQTTDAIVDSSIGANLQLLAQQVDLISNKVYAAPDQSTFTYDETSGYYYDYTTGFYYDATSQYYFNPLTQQYMYWDPLQSTYIPVTSSTTTTTTTTTTTEINSSSSQLDTTNSASTAASEETSKASETSNTKTVKTAAKPKTAAQIAKDMERWAKEQMSKKKESLGSNGTKKPASVAHQTVEVKPAGFVSTSAPKDASDERSHDSSSSLFKKTTTLTTNNHADIEANDGDSENSNEKTPVTMTTTASKVEATIDTSNLVDEASLIDTGKMACLLCKRRFDSLDILNKHVAKSDLHKTNLEKLKQEKSLASTKNTDTENNDEEDKQKSDSLQEALQYRDRAKERREKYGLPEPPVSKYYSSSSSSSSSSGFIDDGFSSYAANTNVSILEKNVDSVASKMMRKMGYKEGSGIGKNLQGIQAPIQASIRQKGAGLGANNVEIDPNDSYKEAARKLARARYEQLN